MGSRKILWSVLIILLVIAGAVLVFLRVHPLREKNGNQSPIKKQQFKATERPSGFPTDIPLEANARILQNYNANAPDGRTQATRVFETSKSLADNFTLYKTFFGQGGWAIVAQIDNPANKLLIAKKDQEQVQVTMEENASTHVKIINITVSR